MSLDQFNQLPPERIAGSDDGKTTDYRESVAQRAMCISVLSSLGIVVGHQAEQQRDLSLIHFCLSHLQKGMPLFRKLCLSSEICASSESYACLQKVVPLFRKLCLSSESCASLQVVVPLFRNLWLFSDSIVPLFGKLHPSSKSYASLQKVVPLFRNSCLSSESCASLEKVLSLFR